jgi:hypothetical protein
MPSKPARSVTAAATGLRRGRLDVATLLQRARIEPPVDPALLLPLRLEYRVVDVEEPILIGKASERQVGREGARVAKKTAARTTRAKSAAVRGERERVVKDVFGYRTTTYTSRQLWLRWFPDDAFSAQDPLEPTADEEVALDRYESAIASAAARLGRAVSWYETGDSELAGEWQRLANEIGFFRAVHLLRDSAGGAAAQTQPFIVGLPEQVSIFALTKGSLAFLAQGAPIPDTLRYSPDALGAGQWLTDFDRAVTDGMGARLRGAVVDLALKADWLIVTGLRAGDARPELERFLKAAMAAGDFELVPQDTPTNNSARDAAGFEAWIRDPVRVLTEVTFLERRPATASSDTDADLLATALGIPATALYGARNGEQREIKNARAMATALLPGLTSYFEAILQQESVSPDAFRAFLGATASARGPLPVVRVGDNPYGILPIALPGALAPPVSASPPQGIVFNFLQRFAGATIAANEGYSAVLPVVRPGGVDQTDALRRILQTLPVSSRLDATSGDDVRVSASVACPLVFEGSDAAYAPASYCDTLVSQTLAKLPNPDARDTVYPLLYRLLRLSLERILELAPSSLRALSARAALLAAGASSTDPAVERLRTWVPAVEWLGKQSRARLEVLMLEVIDLLDHRIDAWQTSLATTRLTAQRSTGQSGLRIGYYGMLASPRATSATGATDGYIQAPSLAQATTAGLLRSAALRHSAENGPFRVNLSSRRVRKALKTLDGLRKGLTLAEVLGYHAERWLHDEGLDVLLYELRDQYSIQRGSGAAVTKLPLLDGQLLLSDAARIRQSGSAAKRAAAGRMLDELTEQLDAFADVVVAEAVHQIAHGSPGGVTAWMKVLTGSAPPPESVFLRTHRAGHSSSYRVLYLSEPATYTGPNPRAIAEPLLAELAETFADGFDRATVRATISVPGETTSENLLLELADDLDMEPVDLLIGGTREVSLRVRAYVLAEWQKKTNAFAGTLGPLPETDLAGFLNQQRPLTLDFAYTVDGSPTVDSLVRQLAPLGQVLSRSRALTPADLNAASAVVDDGFDAETFAARYAKGVAALRARAQKLETALTKASADLLADGDNVVVQAREILRRDSINEVPGIRDRAAEITAFRAAKLKLERHLLDVSAFAMPDALTPYTMEDVIGSPDGYDALLQTLQRQLTSKIDGLASALAASVPGAPPRAAIDALTLAIQNASDGEAIRIWPPCDVQADTTPAVGSARPIADALGSWPQVRPSLRPLLDFSDVMDDLAARVTARAATTDARHPAISYIGVHLLPTGDLPDDTAVGFVLDEWNDFRPSAAQTTGLAINYDSPQGEPPHVMLLGVAPNDGVTAWTDAHLAGLVQETIRLMRIRPLASRTGSFIGLGLRAMNLVPSIPAGRRGRERIPLARLEVTGLPKNKLFGWRMVTERPDLARTAGAIIERDPTEDPL